MSALNARYDQLLSKTRDAMRGGHGAWAVQSTGEKVAVALVLNRADWLSEYGYTIAEAIERAGQEWTSMIPQIARQLADEPTNLGGGRADIRLKSSSERVVIEVKRELQDSSFDALAAEYQAQATVPWA